MSRQAALMRSLWKSVPLPLFNQGSTLSIRGSPYVKLSVRILPQWRDDAQLTLQQVLPLHGGDEVDLVVDTHRDALVDTSLGRKAALATVTVDLKRLLFPDTTTMVSPSAPAEDGDPAYGFASRREGCDFQPLPEEFYSDNDDTTTALVPSLILTAKVPEKCNLVCHVEGHGDLDIADKMEGDAELSIAGRGNITCKKLRGYRLDLRVNNGHIHATKLLEARDIRLDVAQSGRLRARMLNGSDVHLHVKDNDYAHTDPLDADDAGALVDVGSLYTSDQGDGAVVEISASEDATQTAARHVRVKSHHGHLTVTAVQPPQQSTADDDDNRNDDMSVDGYGNPVPLVDIGGMNGSCDVSILTAPTPGDSAIKTATIQHRKTLAAKIHVDSLVPNSVSVVTCDRGDVEVTLDRKVEVDVRLLSTPKLSDFDVDDLLDNDTDVVREALCKHDGSLEERQHHHSNDTISVRTDAYTESDSTTNYRRLRYREGSVDNRSLEPDSRFDVRTKGEENTNRQGKINVEHAARQALRGFSGVGGVDEEAPESADNGMRAEDRPLLGVATGGGSMTLETVSWFGAIARRYGMEENERDLGRQAKTSVKTE